MKEPRGVAGSADRASRDGEPFRMAVLSVPADRDYLALARLAAMQVAGLLGLSVGRLTDLRLAVSEACSLLLSAVPAQAAARDAGDAAGNGLELRFERCLDHLRVTVCGPAPRERPESDGLGWLLLEALVGDVRMETKGGKATLTLTEPLPAGT
jgi:serine/threonine-protein kinase RsbW